MTAPESPISSGVPSQETQAGTPSPLQGSLTIEALDTIEFGAVLELVAARAAGPLGAERVRQRQPVTGLAAIRRELARVGEVAALFRRRDGLAVDAVPDVRSALARLRIEGSVLDVPELAGIRQVLAAGRHVRDELVRVREQAPLTATLAADSPPRAIERRLDQSVNDDGELLDGASPALAAARREARAARERLVRRLEAILRSLDAGTEATVTVRRGRYVIPVRRDLRARPDGIVLDESATAGTLFVEPTAAVELGNALSEAQAEEEREILRVLRELTDLLRPERPALLATLEMCVAADDLVARARWAAETDGWAPAVDDAPATLRIVRGRHPLLTGEAGPVIPFDLDMAPGERTLLVSGPNTGGKTVLLKAVALFAALVQSGIVPPVADGSALPVFSRFAADIGDRQSIAASLSTFSAHMRTVGEILREADDTTLVLLDEIGSGTDPAEGAALAAAAIVALTRRGTLTLATTHLGQLKTLAHEEPGVVNASLQFDAATLTPTYRFAKGTPGRSYGIAIARRLGLPAETLADAERRVPAAERSFDALLADVEERQRMLERRELEVAARDRESAELAGRVTARDVAAHERAEALKEQERTAERRAREAARAYLLDARKTVEAALAEARAAGDEAAAREIRRSLEDEIRRQGAALDAAADAPGAVDHGNGRAGAGDAVVTPAGLRGTVAEVRSDGTAVVMAGALRLLAPAADLTVVPSAGRQPASRRELELPRADAPMEIDLRGMTGDDAEAATLAAIDAAVLAEHPFLRIIHGMGTGVVRDRVRRVLQRDRRVRHAEFAPRNQGGTGVTIVEFGA